MYQEVVKKMMEEKFPFMGVSRSISEYYDGYGYCVTVALFVIAIILWLISTAASQNENNALVKNISWTLAFGLLAWGIGELIFFFPFAAGITLLASAFIFISVFVPASNKN